METKEFEESNLHKVIEVTLEEYISDCERDGYHKDKSGYIGQILSKVVASYPEGDDREDW